MMRTSPFTGVRPVRNRGIRGVELDSRDPLTGGVIVPPVDPDPDPDPDPEPEPTPEGDPTLPTAFVDVSFPVVTGTVYEIASGDNAGLQAAIDAATYGDCIELAAGGSWNKCISLPFKSGWTEGAFVTIRPSNHAAITAAWPLQSDGTAEPTLRRNAATNPRMTPTRAAALGLPMIRPDTVGPAGTTRSGQGLDPCVTMLLGAKGYYLWGLRFDRFPGKQIFSYVNVTGTASTSPDDLGSYLVLQQCVIGSPTDLLSQNGFRANGAHVASVNGTICGQWSGVESHGWHTIYGRGPLRCENNSVLGSGINFFVGGITMPAWHAGVVPSDITVKYNHFYKPASWNPRSPSYISPGPNGLKNSWECKYGIRYLVHGNVCDGSAYFGQNGQSFTVKQSKQYAPDDHTSTGFAWCETGHLTFRYNKTLRCGNGLECYATEGQGANQGVPVHDVLFEHNLVIFDNEECQAPLTGYVWNGVRGSERVFNSQTKRNAKQFRHNTYVGENVSMGWYIGGTSTLGAPGPNTMRDNLYSCGEPTCYGWRKDSTGPNGSLGAWVGTFGTCTHNVFGRKLHTTNFPQGTSAATYPSFPDNFFPATDTEIGVDITTGVLDADSPCKAGGVWEASDGTDNGADIETVESETSGVIVPL